jgi:hypothetical protein
VCWAPGVLTRSAIQISNAEHVGGTALGAVVESGARVVGGSAATATATAAATGGDGDGDAGEEGDDDTGDFHADGW